MSIIRELGHFKVNLSDLPIWAALVVAACIGSFMTMGTMSLITETRVYEHAPSRPILVTGETYAVHVMHGSLRYVTRQDLERLAFWNDQMFHFGFMAFIGAYVVLFVYRKRQE